MIAHLMTSVSRGGLELYVRELILKLHSAGLKQVVVCDQNSFMVADLRAQGIAVEHLQTGSRYSFLRMQRLRALDKKYAVAIWHSHQRDDMIVVALAFLFRTRFRHIFSLYMGFARKKDLLHRLVYRRIEHLVTTSQLMNALALERLPVTIEQLKCIRYGREEAPFKRVAAEIQAAQKTVGLRKGEKLVLSLGRLDPMKGVVEFAAATEHLDTKLKKKLVFAQIGERTIIRYDAQNNPVYAPESEAAFAALQARAKGKGSYARFVLLPFQEKYIPFLLTADYFVLASYDEMYSLSLIDAMLAGCLIIGTDNGGTVEQLDRGEQLLADKFPRRGEQLLADKIPRRGERGLLIPAQSAAAIATALEFAEDNPTLCKKMQKAATAWARHEHKWEQVLPQWLELYSAPFVKA